MGINRIDVRRLNTRMIHAFCDTAPDRFQVGGNKMMGIRRHAPASHFRMIRESMSLCESFCRNDNAGSSFGNNKAPSIDRERTTGFLWGRLRLTLPGPISAVHRGKARNNGLHQGKINSPADRDVGHPLRQKHGSHDQGGAARRAGCYRCDNGSRGLRQHGNLTSDHVDAGVWIRKRMRESSGGGQ